MTQGKWRPKENLDLVHKAQELLAQVRATRREVRFLHVKGHSNHRWNDRADQLANRGATGLRSAEVGPVEGGVEAAPIAVLPSKIRLSESARQKRAHEEPADDDAGRPDRRV